MTMPISPIVLQRRHAELGRIRLGHKAGNGKSARPAKLAQFRFTSPSERYVRDLAELYGGDPRPWDNGGKPEFEVFSEASSIPVIVVKGGLSQWMETWSGGGCAHRCDGERMVDGTPCENDTATVKIKGKEYRAHDLAEPHTRLSVMLPELEALGVWRLESKGWNAAAEIPAIAELAQFVGELVPAVLHLVERRAVRDGQTSRFVVPVLDLQIGAEQLREIVAAKSGAAAAVGDGGAQSRPALESGSGGRDWLAEARACSTLDEWREVYRQASPRKNGMPELDAALLEVGQALRDAENGNGESSGAGGGEDRRTSTTGAPAPAQEADPDTVWQAVLAEAGRLGMDLPTVEDDFAERNQGVTPETASAGELAAYLEHLRAVSA